MIRLPPLTQAIKINDRDVTRSIGNAAKFEAAWKRALALDSTEFEVGQKRVQKQLDKTAEKSRETSQSISLLAREHDKAGRAATAHAKALNATKTATSATRKETDKHTKSVSNYTEVVGEATSHTKEWEKRLNTLGAGLRNTTERVQDSTTNLRTHNRALRDTNDSSNTFGRGMRNVATSTGRADRSLTSLLPKLQLLKVGLAPVGISALVAGASQLVPLAAGLGGVLTPLAGIAAVAPALVGALGGIIGVVTAGIKGNEKLAASATAVGEAFKPVQQNIQRLVTPGFERLFSVVKSLAPEVGAAATSISKQLVVSLDQLGANLGLSEFRKDITRTGTVAADFLGAATPGIASFLTGFLKLGVQGGPVLTQIGAGFTNLGNRFSSFISRTSADGSLQRFLQASFDGTKRLLGIVGDLGGGLLNLGRQAKVSGLTENIFSSLERGMQGFRDFASTNNGEVTKSFENVSRTVTALGPLLSGAGRLIVTTLAQIDIVPLVDGITRALPSVANGIKGLVSVLNAGVGLLTIGLDKAGGGIGRFVSSLGKEIGSIATTAAPAFGDFAGSVGKFADKAANQLPKVGDVFRRLLPPLLEVGSTLIDAATTALPGFVDGVTTLVGVVGPLFPLLTTGAQVVKLLAQGIGALPGPLGAAALAFIALKRGMFGLGRSVTTETTAVTGGVQGMVRNVGGQLRTLGTTVRTNIRSTGDEVGRFGSVVGGIATTVRSGLSPVTSTLSGVTSSYRNALTEHQSLMGALGRTGPVAGFTSQMSGLRAAASTAATAGFGALRSAGGGLIGAMGGPWGLAITAGIGLFSAYSNAVEKSKQKMEAAKTAGDQLVRTYAQLGSSTDAQARLAGRQAVEQAGLADAFDSSSSSAGDQARALRGNADAQQRVLDGVAQATRDQYGYGGSFQFLNYAVDKVTGSYDDNEEAARALFDEIGQSEAALSGLTNIMEGTGSETENYIAQVQQLYGDQSILSQNTGTLAEQMERFRGETSEAQDGLSQLNDTLSTFGSEQAAADQATSSLAQAVDNLRTNMEGADEAGNDLTETSLNLDGTINTASAGGQALAASMRDLKSSYDAATSTAYDLAVANGDVEGASAAAGAAADKARGDFVAQAEQLGYTTDQANALADQYGLIPGSVVTQITQPGMTPAQIAADILRGKVIAVPDDKTIITSALTADAISALRAVGLKVETLPDGTVRVTADTAAASSSIQGLIGRYQNYPINMTVAARSSGIYAQEHGGIMGRGPKGEMVQHFAKGGIKSNMRANWATVVPPKSYRVVGDRSTHNEAFIPLNGSKRSTQILKHAASEMGYTLADRAVRHFADGAAALNTSRAATFAPRPARQSPLQSAVAGSTIVDVLVKLGETELRQMVQSEIRAAVVADNAAAASASATGARRPTLTGS